MSDGVNTLVKKHLSGGFCSYPGSDADLVAAFPITEPPARILPVRPFHDPIAMAQDVYFRGEVPSAASGSSFSNRLSHCRIIVEKGGETRPFGKMLPKSGNFRESC